MLSSFKLGLRAVTLRASFAVGVLSLGGAVVAAPVFAQTPAAPAASVSQRGTVKAISGATLTLTPDKGDDVVVAVAPGARVLQIAAGSTDLKSAKVITLDGIAVGDRVLVTGKPGDTAGFTASRVILMKSDDIAQKRAAEAADWQKRGSGGIVTAVNGPVLTVSAGTKKTQVQTTPTTIFRRYAGGSVKFEDAQPSSLAQIHTGDQMRVRGAASDDGSTITAEEIVTGSFRNLSGILSAVDPTAGSVTLKDIATKKTVVVMVTANSQLKALPAGGGMRAGAGGPGAGAAMTPGAGAPRAAGAGGPGAGGPGGGGGRGGDLSQRVARLPAVPLTDFKTGQAVMIVASQTDDSLTAITLLSGVENLLAATPSGEAPMTLSPWTTGAPEGGGGAQ
ncbi:hypothetical protein SAMN05421770_105238 [Granulicella rosea]|uniref:DUF5666 domain-containing protein n=1 Tax=Granulicella rosea TaxID=474952 RepID=A0A239KUS8_9BACT|nr:hypothetical protein [Granulicella rosea]SNT22117.1 hypothetical protein SAMN05421770_105238 [Granulicella rosea]